MYVYKHVYVVLVVETLAKAARILSYFSCDVCDFLFFLKVFSKIIINDRTLLKKKNRNCLNELLERD